MLVYQSKKIKRVILKAKQIWHDYKSVTCKHDIQLSNGFLMKLSGKIGLLPHKQIHRHRLFLYPRSRNLDPILRFYFFSLFLSLSRLISHTKIAPFIHFTLIACDFSCVEFSAKRITSNRVNWNGFHQSKTNGFKPFMGIHCARDITNLAQTTIQKNRKRMPNVRSMYCSCSCSCSLEMCVCVCLSL